MSAQSGTERVEGEDRRAAALGAPAGGALAAPDIPAFLGALLQVRRNRRIWLAASLQEDWEARIRSSGAECGILTLEGRDVLNALMDAIGDCGPEEQVWLNLDRTPRLDHMDLLTLDAFLAFAATRKHPPLVVLMRDDAEGLPRTQRLAVDRHGIVLLLREWAGGAFALGEPSLLDALRPHVPAWDLPQACRGAGDPSRQLLALDVDGVLIDPGRSFHEAVALALADLAPGVPWDDEHFAAFKRVGGFNNDFRLTAGALALIEQGELAQVHHAAGRGFPHLEDRIRELEPLCQAAVQRHYARTRRLERPTILREELDSFPGDLAIFTGRPPDELILAYQVLGFRLPALADCAPHLRKPRPEGLLQLADTFRASRVVFVGDTCDDAAALRSARDLCPGVEWIFAAVGPDRQWIREEGDLEAPRLRDLLNRFAQP
jgi:phosphoglycolate phosphatase-like HAD superfamily hydrolase